MSNALGYTLSDLKFNDVELQRDDLTVHLEIIRGLDELPSMRGADTVIPHLEGRVDRLWVADTLDVELEGFVQGDGATEALRRASFRTLMEELKVLFFPGIVGTLSGLGADGQTYILNDVKAISEPLRWGPQDIPGYKVLNVLLVSNIPSWGVEGGGS